MTPSLERQLTESVQRASRYWYQDGLSEGAVGVLFLIMGLFFGLEARLPADSGWRAASALALPVLIVGGVLGFRWVVRRLKERITYPRTGYVAYRRPPQRKRLWRGVVGGAVGVLISLLLINYPISQAWIPALQGLAVGVFCYVIASRFNLTRYYLYTLISVALGIAATWTIGEPVRGNALFYVVMGVIFMAGGMWVLSRYLCHTQPVEDQ